MAKIGINNAVYRVETALTRSNQNVSKNMSRIATGSNTVIASDRASFSTLAHTLALDIAGVKSAIKNSALMKGFISTAIANIDTLTVLNSQLHELAILGANASNSDADSAAIDLEAEAIADELWRVAENANFKGKDIFDIVDRTEYLSLGGRDAEYTVTFQTIISSVVALYDYTSVPYLSQDNLQQVPSDGISNTDAMTSLTESLQKDLNQLRVELSSHYSALEEADMLMTDLRVQYSLAYDSIEQVNFSAETATLVKNQILQNAAMAMLAQANQSQTGLLKLVS
jgi:flagellin